MENGKKVYKVVMTILLTAMVTFMVTTIAMYKKIDGNGKIKYITTSNDGKETSIAKTLANFRKVIDSEYIGEVDEEQLLESTIKGYIAGLQDPYSEYYTKEEMDELMQETNGNFVGIGIYMTQDTVNNAVLIVSPMEGSPAEEAGIKPGDIITKVDDISYTGEQITEASNKIKGETGTKVKLEIKRQDEIIELEVERRKILVSHMKSQVLNEKIGYLSITDFDGGCAEEFENKVEELNKHNVESFIIDLRNNGGGVVDEALNMLEMIVGKDQTILITTDKEQKEKVTKSKKEETINKPIVVLVNEYSASASEIFAGALKDHKKATLIGTKTYGKGVIQTLHQLTDGSGLKLTTNEYYTPNHNKINKEGIMPDIEVKLPDGIKYNANLDLEQDTQLKRAIEELS